MKGIAPQFLHFYSPTKPDLMDWKSLFPDFDCDKHQVEFLDIGCGYGGLLGLFNSLLTCFTSLLVGHFDSFYIVPLYFSCSYFVAHVSQFFDIGNRNTSEGIRLCDQSYIGSA